MTCRTTSTAALALVSSTLFVSAVPALGSPERDRDPASPAAELQETYPLDPSRDSPVSPDASSVALPRSTPAGNLEGDPEDGGGWSPVLWLVIVLEAGLALALIVHAVSLVVRRLSARLAFSDDDPANYEYTPHARQPRPRHLVSQRAIRLARPFFRYSHDRRAFVLRVIGERFGPVLRPRDWIR